MPSFLTSLTQIFSPSTPSTLPSHTRDPSAPRRSHPSSHLSIPASNGNKGAYYDDAWDIPSSSGAGGLERGGSPGPEAGPGEDFRGGGSRTRDSSRRGSYGYGYGEGSSPTGYGVPGANNGLNTSQTSSTGGGRDHANGRRQDPPNSTYSQRSSRTSSPAPDDHNTQTPTNQTPSRSSTLIGDSSTLQTPTQGQGNPITGGFAYPPVRGGMKAGTGGGFGGQSVGGGGGMSYGWGGNGGGRSGTLDPRSSAIMSNRPVRNRVSSAQSFLSPNGPLQYYPPLNHTWSRIKTMLKTNLPELHDSLGYPVNARDLSDLESALGMMLPPSVRDSYLCVDGQDSSSDCREGLFFGLTLLPLEDVLREWLFWRQVEHDPHTGMNPEVLAVMSSIPPGWIKRKYACKGWLPLIADKCGNYVGVDLDPGTSEEYQQYLSEEGAGDHGPGSGNKAGTWGQVIVFGREFDRKCVLWRGEGEGGWGRWLSGFAEELESGDGWEIDGASDRRGSDGEEDDIGYSSYYFDASSGGNGAGDSYGEGGTAMRLTGEYRGWSVLEAWWDRSVRKWDELGLSVTYADLQKEEQYRLRKAKGKQKEGERVSLQGLGFGGMRIGGAGEDVEIPIPVMDEPDTVILSVPSLQAPPTPGPDTALLGSRSPTFPNHEAGSPPSGPSSARKRLEKLQIVDQTPDSLPRLITPYSPSMPIPTIAAEPSSPTHHPLRMSRQSSAHSSLTSRRTSRESGLLSPPTFASPKINRDKRSSLTANNMPAPAMLDLPTRADVQAAQAVAIAEESGLRGGWVMSMEAVASAPSLASRRSHNDTSDKTTAGRSAPEHRRKGSSFAKSKPADSNEMVDIDLEAGRQARFGSTEMTEQEALEEDAIRTESTGGKRSPGFLVNEGGEFGSAGDVRTATSAEMAREDSRNSHDSNGHRSAGNMIGETDQTPKGSFAERMPTSYPTTPTSNTAPHIELSTPVERASSYGTSSLASFVKPEDEFSDVSLVGQAQDRSVSPNGSANGTTTSAPGQGGPAKSGKRNSMILDKLAKAGLAV